jgi:hypothetical protein
MWIIKVLTLLWPFIKDMVLGDKTLAEAIKDNKKKVMLALMILFSLGLNFFLVSRLIIVSQNYVTLEKDVRLYKEGSIINTPSAGKPSIKLPTKKIVEEALANTVPTDDTTSSTTPVEKPTVNITKVKPTKKPATVKSNNSRYAKMKEDFDKIQAREQSD